MFYYYKKQVNKERQELNYILKKQTMTKMLIKVLTLVIEEKN
jgi:hypothetical protein